MLRNYSVHVPSIARARILPTFFLRRPILYMEGYHGEPLQVVYPFTSWTEAKKDYKNLLDAMNTCSRALENVPKLTTDAVAVKSEQLS
jgi:hypothetical protein